MKDEEMLQFIEETFEENYELLRLEGGHSLSPYVKNLALQQVKLYWEKLKQLAGNVTETEVKLTLPLQKTQKGRTFTIQGVVDVVKDNNETILYDIKTHDVDFVRCNKEEYEDQLNIYAYIWQNIKEQELGGAAIIAVGQTEEIKRAYRSGDPGKIQKAIEEWQPEVPIDISSDKIESTLESFGEVVDMIEEHEFAPPSPEKLTSYVRPNKRFVDHVCRNCDVRFSCDSYKEYAFTSTSAKRDFLFYYDDYGTEYERAEILDANLAQEEEV
jgi:hypothetical protein